MISIPEWRVVGSDLRFAWDSERITIAVEDLHKERFGVYGVVTIESSRTGQDGQLFSADMNTDKIDDRAKVVKYLEPKIPSVQVDWAAALEQVCLVVRKHYQSGQPFVDLTQVDPQTKPRWLLEPFVASTGMSGVFADGGTGKSTFALTVGLAVASGRNLIGKLHTDPFPVGYLDYEDDEYVHAERLRALCRGHGIKHHMPIYHKCMSADMHDSVTQLKRQIAELKIGAVIIDSFGMARGGAPEDAESTLSAGRAIRALGVPALTIDHIPKAGAGEKPRPIGSTYSYNQARVLWYAEASDQGEDGEILLSLTNIKRNKGQRVKPLAYRVRYLMDDKDDLTESIVYEQVDPSRVPGFFEKLSASDRILHELKRGKATYDELIEATGLDKKVLSSRLTELRSRGKINHFKQSHEYTLAAEAVAVGVH